MRKTSKNNKNEITIKSNSIFDKLIELKNQIDKLEREMILNIREQKISFSELFEQVQDNKDLLKYCRSESQITIIQPRYSLLNCLSTKDYEKSSCAMFRSNNIVYLTLIFKGTIEPISPRLAEIALDMPMWKILSGTFKMESLTNCLSIEKEKEKKERENRLCMKLKQNGNKVILKINKNETNIQTYWDKSNIAQFTIKANFFIQPTPVRASGIFYLFNIASTKVVAVNKENRNSELELTNDLYLNNDNGCIKLQKNKNIETEIIYMTGFSDIVYVVLYQDKKPFYLSSDNMKDNGTEEKLILDNEPTTKCQFLIVPKLN